jgi:hypothetical protein
MGPWALLPSFPAHVFGLPPKGNQAPCPTKHLALVQWLLDWEWYYCSSEQAFVSVLHEAWHYLKEKVVKIYILTQLNHSCAHLKFRLTPFLSELFQLLYIQAAMPAVIPSLQYSMLTSCQVRVNKYSSTN